MSDPTNTTADQPNNTAGGNETGDDEPGGRVEEVWTYAGRRVLHGKRYHAWQDGTGRERYYAKSSAIMIGGRYTVSVEREGDRVSMYGEPRYTGDYLDAQTRREMEALDIAAMAALAAQARERRDARQKALDDALQPLVDLAAKVSFGHERDALLAYVIRRLTRPW
jgi:hypothetical protein